MKLTTCFLASLVLAIPLTSAASAGPKRSDDRGLRNLAHDLEGFTRAAVHQADKKSKDRYHDRYNELDAVDALDRLADQARRFRQEVDRSSRDSRVARGDFAALDDAYRNAANRLRGYDGDRKMHDLFGRVSETMGDLASYYGDSRRADGRYRDGDRYYGDRDYRSGDGQAHRPY